MGNLFNTVLIGTSGSRFPDDYTDRGADDGQTTLIKKLT
jgi:hypothetical protein